MKPTVVFKSIVCRILLSGWILTGMISGLQAGSMAARPHINVGRLLRNAMIWYPDDKAKSVVFRKQFRYLARPGEATIYIFADSKYMLWINGQYVMRGPCRFDPHRPEYDSFDVRKYLHTGLNVIAVQAYGHISTGETMEHEPGLAILLKAGTRDLITDSSWRCSNNTRYGDPTVMWDGERENINAAKDDGDWTLAPYVDKAWPLAVRKSKDLWGEFYARITPMQVATELPFSVDGRELPFQVTGKTDLFLRLEKNIVGYCVFELDADSGARLNVFGHHYIARKGRQEYITGGMFGSGVVGTFGTSIRDEPDSVGIPVHVDTGTIRFTSIRVYNFIAPLTLVGSFRSSDTLLNRFWKVIANMHAQITRDTYTDGVTEGNEWVADIHNISQFTRVAFAGPGKNGSLDYADKRFMAKALSDIGVSQQPDGRIKAHHPSDRFDLHWFIEDFACTWVADIRSYYEMTRDKELITRLWPIVKKQMYWFKDSINARGLVHGREWCIFDNPYAYKHGEGATLNAFVYRAFADAAYLAAVCKEEKTAVEFNNTASSLKTAFNTYFWDTNKGTFRGMTDSLVTTHAAVMSLYTGVCSNEHWRSVQDWLLTRKLDTLMRLPLLHLYWFKDLYDMNSDLADQQVLDIIRTRYNNKWNALNKGYITAEGLNRGRNFHNFGMVPGSFFCSYILGVRTVGPVWNKRILIEPRLGDIQQAEGTVVTEYGPVDVSWSRSPGGTSFHVKIPQGVIAKVGIPVSGNQSTLIVDGRTVVDKGKILHKGVVMTDRFIYLEWAGGGSHSGRVAALPAVRGQIEYTNCPGCWNPDSLGNHRVLVHFNGPGDLARAFIQWRRRDKDPEEKRIIVQDARSGRRILNATTGIITRESGEVFFEPVSGKGNYYLYYMPYRDTGWSNDPRHVYRRPDTTASAVWLQKLHSACPPVNCTASEIQSIDSFNSFYPMEVIATAKETEALKAKYKGEAFVVFPEDRLHSIRLRYDLPYRWIMSDRKGMRTGSIFPGEAARGEFYAWQLGVYALQDLTDMQVQFSDWRSAEGGVIPAAAGSCINTAGISYDGHPFTPQVDIPRASVQALWCGLAIPMDARPGVYSGTVTLTAKGAAPQRILIRIRICDAVSKDGSVDDPAKMTRLPWLNSTLAQANTVIAPYTLLQVQGDTISLLGRKIQLGQQGFPEQIQTFFTPEMTGYSSTPNNLLAEDIHFHFMRQSDGKDIKLTSEGLHFTLQTPGTVQWTAIARADELQMEVNASLEFDGFLSYTVKVTALQDMDLKDIIMHIPFQKEEARYLMGLGQNGGYRPHSLYRWKWDVAHKDQDGAWIGTVNAGLQYSLRDERYSRPLNTGVYKQKPMLLPSSWGNEGKGGIEIGIKGKSMLANNYSGPRHIRKGEVMYYNFTLLITPFHTINTDFQWATRFYHRYIENDPDSIAGTGANMVNIHSAGPINPWINYPFIEWKKMKEYIDKAHRLGLKVKIYYTVRELSDHAYETFALRSLGHEIYPPGSGGGFSSLQEHIGEDYIPAWFTPESKDAAIVNGGVSRWHNYYVEGMNWLVRNVGIDGIYLDDVGFDRVTMKRIKRVLIQDGHPGIIDLHSSNKYNSRDGYNNSAKLYMELFPYLNRVWFGERFDYEKSPPDYFLTEVSGIPFGLMGEMLNDGGNPWRGMVYGMTNRLPWTENADPRPIWKVWDEFGMEGTQMIGYWSPSCPVRTSDDKVLATVYRKPGAALVSLASWAAGDTTVQLVIDWQQLGIDRGKATITAPVVKDFQPGRTFRIDEPIPVQKGRGWLLVIK